METFKAFLDYFTVTQWVIIGIGFRVFLWILDRLTDRYFERRFQKRRQSLRNEITEKQESPSRDIAPPRLITEPLQLIPFLVVLYAQRHETNTDSLTLPGN
ncbi:hypothetical protein R9J59_13840 [Escherichia coli]|nr:hypothetical protein [Escherichia coli]EHI0251016.1 hypothetical protein [Escherichia coli]KAE9865373.1 hypothetical protein GP671_19735 [Escherichia coli]MIC25233.1 hypothetical protein [Escherichia coli]MXF94764.1 hypothetical protein [Escherichia coli]